MARYPYLVETASNVLNAVLKQWQNEPYRWLKERDLQAEIAARLNSIFSLQGLGAVSGDYKWAAPGFSKRQTWSRVSLEPYVGYEYNEKKTWCHPDIVIWKDIDSNSEPNHETTTGWPILWACELKYGSSNSGDWDIEKLKLLLSQGRIDYGCAVRVHYARNVSSIGVNWGSSGLGAKLWTCDVTAPEDPDAA